MGNTYSAATQRTLATAAMAKYMHLTKPQLLRLRDIVLPYSKATEGMIERSYIEYGLSKSSTTENNNNNNNSNHDATIFGHLFTLWDTGNGQVDCMEFIVGISVLACKADSFEVAVRFALQVLDVTGLGEIDSRNAFKLLRGICTVASCFGDTVPTSRQLFKFIDSIYDAVTMLSQENDGISHDRFVRRLVSMSQLKEYILVIHPRGQSAISTKNLLDIAGMSDDSGLDEHDITPLDQYLPSRYSPRPTSIISPGSGNHSTVDSLNSHMSSVMLTPLAKIPIL